MSLAILFHFLCAQHVSDINVSIISSLRLCWWIITSVVFFSVRCVLELLVRLVLGGVRFAGCKTSRTKSSNTQRTENKTTDVVIHQHSRKLLMMDIIMSETCWAHKKWNKVASDIQLVFHSSTFRRHLCIMGLGNDPRCRKCGTEEETSVHILREREALTSLRYI